MFLAKLIEPKEAYDLCDVWKIRNTKAKWFTFTKQHSPAFIQHIIDYTIILNGYQEFVSTTDILIPISTDQSPVLFSPSKEKVILEVKAFGHSIAP